VSIKLQIKQKKIDKTMRIVMQQWISTWCTDPRPPLRFWGAISAIYTGTY